MTIIIIIIIIIIDIAPPFIWMQGTGPPPVGTCDLVMRDCRRDG
jgi:hypothetical protein